MLMEDLSMLPGAVTSKGDKRTSKVLTATNAPDSLTFTDIVPDCDVLSYSRVNVDEGSSEFGGKYVQSTEKQVLAVLHRLDTRFNHFESLLNTVAVVCTSKEEGRLAKSMHVAHKTSQDSDFRRSARQKRTSLPVDVSGPSPMYEEHDESEREAEQALKTTVQEDAEREGTKDNYITSPDLVAEEDRVTVTSSVKSKPEDTHIVRIDSFASLQNDYYSGSTKEQVCTSDDVELEWTKNVQLRRGDRYLKHAFAFTANATTSSTGTRRMASFEEINLDAILDESVERKFLTLDPNSKARLVIDIMSLLAETHDMVAIPWVLAWDMNLEKGFRYTLHITTGFWALEILFSCFSGYYEDDGKIQRSLKQAARHYTKGWFALDFFMVFTTMFSSIRIASLSTETGLQLLPFLRVFGLLRMVRLSRPLAEHLDRFLAGVGSRAGLHLVKLLFLVFWLGHVTTCIWFMIGAHHRDGDTRAVWFDSVQYMPEGRAFIDAGPLYQYTTTFHFALAQITANGVEMLSPLNSLERFFNIIFLVFGLFFSSHIVSTFSSSMMRLEMANQQKTERLKQLKQLMNQNQVKHALSFRVVRQVKERMNRSMRLTEEGVPALQLLSSSLLRELRYAVRGARVESMPLLRFLGNIDVTEHVLPELCNGAMHVHVLLAGDQLFQPGDDAHKAYILDQGAMIYENKLDFDTPEVSSGKWLSEATLWCLWRHVGEAAASIECQLFSLDAEMMFDTILEYKHLGGLLRSYGRTYHAHLQIAIPPAAPYPDDLQVAFTEYSDIVTALSATEQMFIGNVALQRLQRPKWGGVHVSSDKIQKLTREVAQGESIVIEDATGVVQRITNVAVLKLLISNRIFAQIGKFSGDGTLTIDVTLPGGKQRRGELPVQTIERVLFQGPLLPLSDNIKIGHVFRETFSKESDQYGVPTKYTRTVHRASLELQDLSSLEALPSPLPSNANIDSSYHGLDACSYRLGNLLFMPLDPDDFAYFSSGKGKHITDMYQRKHNRTSLRSEGADGVPLITKAS